MAQFSPSSLALDFSGSCATITLSRANCLNAFDSQLRAELATGLDVIEQRDDIRAVILTGAGRAFSAGQDLGERAATFNAGGVPDLRASLDEEYNPIIRKIAALPIAAIAAVNGIAFGAGAGIAIGCDIVLAAGSAQFQFGFANVGLGTDCGTSFHLPRLVGQARAMDLALTGRRLDAETALAMGLVSRVVADTDLLAEARKIADEMSAKSAPAIAAIKKQLRANPSGVLDEALNAERDAQEELGQSAEYRDAVMRFAQK